MCRFRPGRTPSFLLVLGSLLVPAIAFAQRPGSELCRNAIAATERSTGVPDRLMQAIGVVESGRADPSGTVAPWPWAINVEGVGEIYESKAEVIAAVRRHQAAGARSIDVGCMQVNLLHHGSAFASLEDAFDPTVNAQYAARFLQQLLSQTGSWPRAVGGYHSLTPDIGGEYARKVLAVWGKPDPALRASAPAPAKPIPVSAPVPGPMPSLPSASVTSISASPAPTIAAGNGRGLESYRASPIRFASAMGLHRF